MPNTAEPARLADSRIIKKLLPEQGGAKKLARRFGDALVCVRYRKDEQRGERYTTVELLIERVPIPPDKLPQAEVQVTLDPFDRELRLAACALGARWNPQQRQWTMSRQAAKQLQLLQATRPASPPMDIKNGK